MIYTVTHIEDEIIEGEIEGVHVRVTKRHIVQLPVEISADWKSRQWTVVADPEAVDVSCLIVADVVGQAAPTPVPPLRLSEPAPSEPRFDCFKH